MENEETELKPVDNPFLFLVKAQSEIEKLRVAAQVRQSHLKRRKERDPETDLLVDKLLTMEAYVDGRVAEITKDHPAAYFFTRVKGVGKENIGKVIGFVDIQKADTVSSLWKYAGMHTVNGIAPKRIPGQKLEYNSRLRSMCWRLGTSLMKGGGKFYEYYVQEKTKLTSRFKAEGVQIVPAAALPTEDGKKYEPEGMISEGHVHNMALRKMMKLFLSCLWQAWREAEGLPTRSPYVLEYFPEHTHFISWQEMVDRPEKKAKKIRVKKAS